MANTVSTVAAGDLQQIVNNPDRGAISLLGDHGGRSRVTGEIYLSNVIAGCLAIETEHGTLYLPLEDQIQISEDDGASLDARQDGSVYAIDDILTSHLGERFGWYTTDEPKHAALTQLVKMTAQAVDDLLEQFPTDTSCQHCGAAGHTADDGIDVPTSDPEPDPTSPCHLVIERQYGPAVVIRYDNRAQAEKALVDDLFVDGLCEEDCLDAYTCAEVPTSLGDVEFVLPPQD